MIDNDFTHRDDDGATLRKRSTHSAIGRIALTALAPAILSACAVGPDYHAVVPSVPLQWHATAEQDAAIDPRPPRRGAWWKQLGDPMLDTLIADAAAGSLDLASARAKVREARALARQAGAARYPSLAGTASYKRGGGSGAALGSTNAAALTNAPSADTQASSGPSSLYQAGFDASWELDIFGANRRAAESAQYGLDAAEWTLRASRLTLIGDVATYYVAARGYQARLALARNTAASQEATARLTRVRYAAGAVSALDVANADGLAQTTRSSIPELETSYLQAVAALAVVSGKAPDALIDRMAAPGPIPQPDLPVPAGVPADILLARPDVRSAERHYAQYTAKLGQAEAARYPSVTLTGNIVTSGTQFGDLGSRSTIGWSIGPSLSIPIFNAGRLKAAVEMADAQREQYFIAYNASVLSALKDVENAGVALSRETARVRALQASARSYEQAATLARALFDAGSTGFLDALIAERAQLSARDALIQSQVLIANDYIALNKALGGGWDGIADSR
ncbi:efflux transporter outer membrane subunit [Burkholderia sp. Ac-20379]|uniref:efflux transporter outer membrane subunit n=1 Tax=Burkholderia sp. Ac-20379 TaxID=2703900 RepID=UPI00197D520B|nr:efflux transporter outer membrane subunit [Burkholderia sp. Ac-20379]MBN3723693.1 efflux transporter outer membrane subunit [Burkholderia sp. Ac-20379]